MNRSQLQLRSGVTLPLLTRYWNNATTEVKLEALEKIARALGVQANTLLVEEDGGGAESESREAVEMEKLQERTFL